MAPSRFDYRATAERILNGTCGAWLAVPKSWFSVLTIQEAVFCSYFLNIGKKERTSDGWLLLNHTFVQNWLGIADSQQDKLINTLEEKGLLELQSPVNPNARFMRLRTDRLQAMLDDSAENKAARYQRNRGVSYARDRR